MVLWLNAPLLLGESVVDGRWKSAKESSGLVGLDGFEAEVGGGSGCPELSMVKLGLWSELGPVSQGPCRRCREQERGVKSQPDQTNSQAVRQAGGQAGRYGSGSGVEVLSALRLGLPNSVESLNMSASNLEESRDF